MPTDQETQLSDISGALAVELGPTVFEQMNRKTVLASRMAAKPGRGKTAAWDVRFSAASAGTYTEGATVTDDDLDQDDRVQASLSWGLYRSAFGLSTLTRAVASNSPSSPQEFEDLIGGDAKASASELVSTLNGDLYSGSSGIVGLDTALDASTTYAGINKSTHSEWQGTVLANSGTDRSLTAALLRELWKDIYIASGMVPDTIVTTPAIAAKYEGLFDSKLQIVTSAVGELSASGSGGSPGPQFNSAVGETGLTFKGVQVLQDKDATAGHLYMLNSEFMDLKFVPVSMDSLGVDMASMAQEMGLTETDLMAHFSVLGRDGSRDRFLMEIFPQLCVKRVNCHGYIDDIAE